VQKHDRLPAFSLVKALVYADTEDQLQELFADTMNDPVVTGNTRLQKHVQDLYDRRPEWALCCRKDLPVRANNTNNYVERAMRVLKDSVLQWTKAFNIPQLVDFIITRFESHYQRRLMDIANNRLDYVRLSRFVPSSGSIDTANIKHLSGSLYDVPSETKPDVMYIVDTTLSCCSCYKGNTGGPCKHQSAVMTTCKQRNSNFLPVSDPVMRQLFYAISTGNSVVCTEWFKSLVQETEVVSTRTGDLPATLQSQPHDLPSCDGGCSDMESVDPVEETQDVAAPDAAESAVLLSRFDSVCDKIKAMYAHDPLSFARALQSFCKQGESICTPSAMLTALHSFGKYSGAAVAVSKKRHLVGLKTIGVQPTAVARRRMPVGGRRRVHMGRPAKRARVDDHGYCVARQRTGVNRQVWRKRSAPHSLSDAVSNVQTLGRTHVAK